MKATYSRLTGEYIDNEDSHPKGYHLPNLERFGLVADQVQVVEVPREDQPWNKKLVDGDLVADFEKLAVEAAAADKALAARVRAEQIVKSAGQKLKALGLTSDGVDAIMGGG